MPIENYGRVMQGAADFAMMPYNTLQDSRTQQKRNALLDIGIQRAQGELDDDAEWDSAYQNRDWDTLRRLDPQATEMLMAHEQQQQMSGLGDIPVSQNRIDTAPIRREFVEDRNFAATQQDRQRNYNLNVAQERRLSAPPRSAANADSPQALSTDGNGAVIDYGKTTDGERTAVGYLDRIVSARKSIESPVLANYVPSMSAFMAFASLLDDDTGVIGATAANKLLDDNDREYMGQALDLILAKMRKESGATIKGGEFRKEYINLFPMPNDPPKVLADKKVKRQLAENQLRKASGRAAGPVAVENPTIEGLLAYPGNTPTSAPKVVNWDDL